MMTSRQRISCVKENLSECTNFKQYPLLYFLGQNYNFWIINSSVNNNGKKITCKWKIEMVSDLNLIIVCFRFGFKMPAPSGGEWMLKEDQQLMHSMLWEVREMMISRVKTCLREIVEADRITWFHAAKPMDQLLLAAKVEL